MMELYYWPTPNGRKITIFFEEANIPYKIIKIDIQNDEQYNKKFSMISPTNKIPVIYDSDTKKYIFESGTILFYLAKKYNQLLPKKYYWEILSWLTFQTSQVGPFLGQAHQFLYYNPGKSSYAEKKYIEYGHRIYETLEKQLNKKEYLVNQYSIADIATWPWIARFERQRINIEKFPNVLKWYKNIARRPAVIKGFNPDNENEKIPLS